MKEFNIIDNKLYHREQGAEEWTAYTVEELSNIIIDKVQSQQLLNEDYLKSIKEVIDPFLKMAEPQDKRYEVAKSALEGILARGVSKYVSKDYYDESLYDELIPLCFKIADKFMKEYEKNLF